MSLSISDFLQTLPDETTVFVREWQVGLRDIEARVTIQVKLPSRDDPDPPASGAHFYFNRVHDGHIQGGYSSVFNVRRWRVTTDDPRLWPSGRSATLLCEGPVPDALGFAIAASDALRRIGDRKDLRDYSDARSFDELAKRLSTVGECVLLAGPLPTLNAVIDELIKRGVAYQVEGNPRERSLPVLTLVELARSWVVCEETSVAWPDPSFASLSE